VEHGAVPRQAPDKSPEEGHPGGGNLKCDLKSDLAPVGSRRPEQNGDPGGGEKRRNNPDLGAPCRSVPAGAASQREKASSPSRTGKQVSIPEKTQVLDTGNLKFNLMEADPTVAASATVSDDFSGIADWLLALTPEARAALQVLMGAKVG